MFETLGAIDVWQLHAQLAAAAAQAQAQVGQLAADPAAKAALDTTKDVTFGGSIARVGTDVLHAAWGGSTKKHPPVWVLVLAPFVLGIVGVGIALTMSGVNPFDVTSIARILGLGVTGAGPTAVTMGVSQNLAQTGNPTVVLPSATIAAIERNDAVVAQVSASGGLPGPGTPTAAPGGPQRSVGPPVPGNLRPRGLAPWRAV